MKRRRTAPRAASISAQPGRRTRGRDPVGPTAGRGAAWARIRLQLCVSLLLVAGCKGFERDAQCRAIATAVNERLQQIATLDSTDERPAAPNSYIDIAQHYRELERELAALESSATDELGQASAGLRSVLRVAAEQSERYAELLRDLQSATSAEDIPGKKRSRRGLDAARKRMDSNVKSYATARQRLERLCAIR